MNICKFLHRVLQMRNNRRLASDLQVAPSKSKQTMWENVCAWNAFDQLPFLHRNRRKMQTAESQQSSNQVLPRQGFFFSHWTKIKYSTQLKCKNKWINESVLSQIWLELQFKPTHASDAPAVKWTALSQSVVAGATTGGATVTERPVEKPRRPFHLRSLHTFTNYILLAADKLFMWAGAFFFFLPVSSPYPAVIPALIRED